MEVIFILYDSIFELANEFKGSNPGIDYWCLYAVK